MTSAVTRGLASVSTTSLERLHAGLHSGQLRLPITRVRLIGFGVREQLEALAQLLGGHTREACLAILDAVLAERARERPAPELVWTGPEGAHTTARDTAVILRDLFESARERVVLAGYSFSDAVEVFGPLHQAMKDHAVEARFFVDVEQGSRPVADPEKALQAQLQAFIDRNWKFGPPFPELYCDCRAIRPGPPWSSLHAKCVAVDGKRAFLSSANFTNRGQQRNIEAGVLIHDPTFAAHLERQWLGLIEADLVLRWQRRDTTGKPKPS